MFLGFIFMQIVQKQQNYFTISNQQLREMYKFQYGTSMMPHPAKARKGGEDALFVSDNILVVCDGVSSWSSQGVDPALYSRTLCQIIEQLVKEEFQKYIQNPITLLIDAVKQNKYIGSTTVCIAALHPTTGVLKTYYIGDSVYGFINSKNVEVVAQQQARFNCPYQVGTQGNQPDQGILNDYAYQNVKDKILLLATDGLWDNLKLDYIKDFAYTTKNISMKKRAQDLVFFANDLSLNEDYQSPFYLKGKAAGYQVPKRGKQDDITVVIARIIKQQTN